ncbi:MAG: outer membrane beta-barrel protein, partial [Chitinophagaceae bacterium]
MEKTKLLILLVAILLLPFISLAQKGQLSGTLMDTSGKKPIVYATVTVFSAKDTSIITYRLSDEQGKFKVPSLPFQKELRVVVTATGSSVWRKEFTLTEEAPSLDLGMLKLDPDVKEMEEVLVMSERPPVVVRKDTIEFNAAAFKTLPTALVEDLLKKMPGVDVDRDGNIMVNGRKVNRLLVEGKEFFGSDPKIASKNLPANLIDKVQVTDDKEELLRNPDLTAGEVGQVINLKLKKAIKQGWFGKLYAGAGTEDRFEGGGIVNMFRDTLQVSLLGYTNNLSRSGFSMQDVMNIGGFSRSNVNMLSISSDGGFAINDISFGGMGGQGIQRSSGGGINVNTLLGKRTTLSMQYFYGENKTRTGQRINNEQFFNDTTLTTRTVNSGESYDKSHRLSGNVKIKIDSFSSTLEYRPSFTFSNADATSLTQIESFSNFEPKLNESTNELRRSSEGFATSHELYLNKQFRKKGRTLYASLLVSFNSNETPQFNDAENIFYKNPSSSTLRQLRQQDQDALNTRAYVGYNEPLTKKLSLRLNQTTEYFTNKDYIDTYEFDPLTGEYVIPDQDLTNGLERSGWRNTTYAGLRFSPSAKFNFTAGANLRTLNLDNEFRKNPTIRQNYTYLMPALNLTYKQWSLNYSANLREPNATDLQPVVNNTNPLYLSLGNPDLKPTISHNAGVYTYINNAQKQLTFNFNTNFSYNTNAVIRERSVNENGVQITRPINVDGTWNAYLYGSLRKQYKFSNTLKFSAGLNINTNFSRTFIIINQNRSNANSISFSPSTNITLNWNDKIEFTQRYSPTLNKTTYESNAYPSLEVWRHTTSTEMVVRMPKHLVWESTLDYFYNPQVAPGIQKSSFRWNAAVNVLFLKQDKGQLKLSVYDLLNQNISVTRTVRENYIQDTESIILRRYFL